MFKKGDTITALEDIIIPNYTFIRKGEKCKLISHTSIFNSWHIDSTEAIIVNRKERREEGKRYMSSGYFTEDELIKKFNCTKIIRKQKLKKLNDKV